MSASAIIGGCVAVCTLGVVFARPSWVEGLVLDAMVSVFPAREALATGVDTVAVGATSRSELAAENDALREENARLRLRVALYDETRAALERARSLEHSGIPAAVIVAPSRSPYDTFVVDVGTRHGVAIGDEARFDSTISLGTVEAVGSRAARVRLFSSPGVETPVSVGATSTALYMARGQGGGGFVLDVPKSVAVAPGDALMRANGLEAIGFVVDVTAHDADAFQVVSARMPINIFETRMIAIDRGAEQLP